MPDDQPALLESLLHRAVLSGDEQAWRELYDSAFEPLANYVRWRCGGRPDRTEEILQETWLTAVRRIRDFDPSQARFQAWLRGIAVNVLRNHLRSANGHAKHMRPLNGELPTDCHPDASLQQEEQSDRIAQALLALPEHYESVLRAKYVDQLSVTEIAAIRGETPKAVESLLTRARQAFRKEYLKRE